ncbi:MAG: aminotransferase class I/II-fold pyridoxal phosphate-dependent enzyme [Archangium sp.]|nr:aminotransferase class I/II-fold pyridoxal phosphate-dependent enzyme [Archangium sp.]MDP3574276.1 aminotransferase class I/II-fold pyridoxal phosphate-dependent enzyme [Archangium sp.]
MLHLIPSRQQRPDKDVIFALNAEATRRKQAGESVVNATIGSLMNDDGSLSVLNTVSNVLREVPANDWAAYAPIPGMPGFVQAVIDDTFSTQPQMKAAATAVATPGGTGALRHALMNYLQSGQAMLTPNFYWGPYQTLAEEHERKVDTFKMFTEAGGLDVAALDAKVTEQLKTQGRVLLILNDPCNNPTGYSMTRAEWRSVVEVLLRHADQPVTLLVDMAYWLYAGDGDHRAFLGELTPLLGKTGLLFAWSGSKTYTHYGLRVGALLACEPEEKERNATQAALAYACRGTWSNCVRGGMVAVTRLLTDPALKAACDDERQHFKRLLQNRVKAFNAAAVPKGLVYPRYEGGFFVTVFHPDAEAQARRMQENGVYVVPQKGALRVALCSAAESDVPRLVEALAAT